MHNRDITDILNKIDEMRAVFVLGQRAVPFLEEVFFFLKEISPLMDEINASIRESTATMPRATSQLQSVSAATELATTEIMDLVDAVLAQLSPMEASLNSLSEDIAVVDSSSVQITDALRDAYGQLGEDLPLPVMEAIAAQNSALKRMHDQRADLHVLTEIRAKVNRIMISLQVQDITAQQIASVNHLIESIRDRMNALAGRLGWSASAASDDSWPVYSNTHFDPHARYERGTDRQSIVDRVMAGGLQSIEPATSEFDRPGEEAPVDQGQAEIVNEKASQAEIDALFQNGFSG
jgi:chemotaxis regulatin CheY-phosphate phosphatase CheZ